jgi:hypothetical protein
MIDVIELIQAFINRAKSAVTYGDDMVSSRDLCLNDCIFHCDKLLSLSLHSEPLLRFVVRLHNETQHYMSTGNGKAFFRETIRLAEGFLIGIEYRGKL